MRATLQRLMWIMLLLGGSLLGVASPAEAARQIRGTATLNATSGTPCPDPPPAPFGAFDEFDPIVMKGSLDGCWYTDIDSSRTTPSGVYLEQGREVFIGSLDGGPVGTFTTTYRFEGKFAADGTEIHGRCQHPIVAGSGTGGFAGVTGRIFFKDIIGDPVVYVYRGHLSFGPGSSSDTAAARTSSAQAGAAAAASGGC